MTAALRSCLGFLALAALTLSAAQPAAASKRQPFDLGILVAYDETHGEEDLRRQLEASLLAALEEEGCFRSVRIVDAKREDTKPADGLTLQIVLSELEERSRFGASVAQLSDPDRTPDVDRQVVVETEAFVTASVVAEEFPDPLRAKRFQTRAAYKPRLYEDPRTASWDELIRNAVRTTRRFVCRGSIEKDLRRASR